MPGLQKLVGLDLSLRGTEVSVVNEGANEKPRFPISKARDGMPEQNHAFDEDLQEVIKSVFETPSEHESDLDALFDGLEPVEKQKLDDKGKAAVRAAMRALGAVKEQMPPGFMGKLAGMMGMASKAGHDNGKYPPPKAKDPVQKDRDGVKGLNDDQRAEMTSVMKSRDDKIIALQTEVRKERDARETRELVEKAKTSYPGISSPEVLGPVLKRLHDAAEASEDEKLVGDIGTILGAASELVEKSKEFEEIGNGSQAPSINGSDWQAIEKAAAGFVEKSGEGKVTNEQAVSAYLDTPEGAEAYDRYLDANSAQTL